MKLRITFLVIVTCYLGYYLGIRHENPQQYMVEIDTIIPFLNLVLGTFLTSSGAAILNQYRERHLDKLMDRTKNRPLPTKRISLKNAFFISLFFMSLGFSLTL